MKGTINAYLGNGDNYLFNSFDSGNGDNTPPFVEAKVIQENSLQEKLRILRQQIRERKELSKSFEEQAQDCINELFREKERAIEFRQDASSAQFSISKIRMSVKEEKSKAWKDISELEVAVTNVELELSKRRINNSRLYDTSNG